MLKRITNTTQFIKNIIGDFTPTIGIVIGSGLGDYAEQVESLFTLKYSDIEGFPISRVEGHKGELIFGRIEGKDVVVMNGRFHYYEGYEPQEVVFGIRVMRLLGVDTLLVSNAAGAINQSFSIGDLMIITDHISFIPNPLVGQNIDELGVRFPSMDSVYNRFIREKAWQSGIVMQSGVYAALTGPSYETRAEIKFLRTIGADAVGMSTAPEVIAAAHCGMRVFGVSVITNICASDTPPTHEEVIEAGKMASEDMTELFNHIIVNL
ncbi:MAG: purine-nucleoside phosphorylase [Rikenellaceae bacterium]